MTNSEIKNVFLPHTTVTDYENICQKRILDIKNSGSCKEFYKNQERGVKFGRLSCIFLLLTAITAILAVFFGTGTFLPQNRIIGYVFGGLTAVAFTSFGVNISLWANLRSKSEIDGYYYLLDRVAIKAGLRKDAWLIDEEDESFALEVRNVSPFYNSLIELGQIPFKMCPETDKRKIPNVEFDFTAEDQYIVVNMTSHQEGIESKKFTIYCPETSYMFDFATKLSKGVLDFTFIDDFINDPSVYIKDREVYKDLYDKADRLIEDRVKEG